MNRSISLIVVAVLAVAAASVGAVQLDWNQDVLGQFKAQMAPAGVGVPAAKPVDAFGGANRQPESLQARPLGSDLAEHAGRGWDDSVDLMLNNDGDRVGVEYATCDPATEHSNDDPPTCDYLEFYFPDLRVRGADILWGDAVIGRIKKGFFSTSVKLAKGYRLTVEKRPAVVDRGFDRDHVQEISVRLVRQR